MKTIIQILLGALLIAAIVLIIRSRLPKKNRGLTETEVRNLIDSSKMPYNDRQSAHLALNLGLYEPQGTITQDVSLPKVLAWMYGIKHQNPDYYASVQKNATDKKRDVMLELAESAAWEAYTGSLREQAKALGLPENATKEEIETAETIDKYEKQGWVFTETDINAPQGGLGSMSSSKPTTGLGKEPKILYKATKAGKVISAWSIKNLLELLSKEK